MRSNKTKHLSVDVLPAGLSLLRALLPDKEPIECENQQKSQNGRGFTLLGPADWSSSEDKLWDSVAPLQELYGSFWYWANDILLNDWDHMIPYLVKQEWEGQGGCRTVATLARIAAKIGPGQIPTMSYYECSSEDHTERIAFTEEVFEIVFRRHYQIWSDHLGFDQFAREFKEALFLSMRDLFIDRQMDESAMAETSHGLKILSWQELRCRLLCRLCEHIRTWSQCSSHMDGHRDSRTDRHRIPGGFTNWFRAIRASRPYGLEIVGKRLTCMKYGDLISILPMHDERRWVDVHLGSRAFESRDAPKHHEMIMEYFEAQGNKLKPCSMEVDEIVDEIATVGLIPDSDKLLVTQMVIDYLLEYWTPPSSTTLGTVCREIRPAPNDEFRRVKDAKGKLRRHISDLAAAARYEVLSSGVVPEDISTLGVPFVISRKPQAPSLPLGPLMWAYDILRYDLLHVLPAGYIRSMRRIPSVVELARYAASKLPKPGHQTNPLYCYPHELYNNITEVTDFRSWVDDTIACRLQSRETETRLLCLPTQHDIRNTIKMKWAEHLLRSCWDKAGQSKDGVSKPVFLAMVFSHVCEVMRSE